MKNIFGHSYVGTPFLWNRSEINKERHYQYRELYWRYYGSNEAFDKNPRNLYCMFKWSIKTVLYREAPFLFEGNHYW